MDTNTSIHTRALLVWLRISTWSARKYDKTVTNKVNAQYAASSDASRVNKLLMPGDAKAYKTLVTLAGAIRQWHYEQTLAWSDEGWRLLPTANYSAYADGLRDRRSQFADALNEFASDYPTLRAQAARLLNGMYRDEDYPTTQDLRCRFAIGVEFAPVPAAGDIRCDLASDQTAALEASIEDRVQRATDLAVRDAWQRLYDVTAHACERLSQPDAVFRDSLIGNVRETCDVLKRLNVTGSADLETMRQRVEKELTKYGPEALRDFPDYRAATADKAQRLMDAMQAIGYGAKAVA